MRIKISAANGCGVGSCRLTIRRPVAEDWPELLAIVEERVKPERAKLTKNAIGRKRAMFWWQFGSTCQGILRRHR